MKPAVVRKLAQEHSLEELQAAAEKFENSLDNTLSVEGDDDGEILSHLLVASFIKKRMSEGAELNHALREYTQKVRKVIRKT